MRTLDKLLLTRAERKMLAELDDAIRTAKRGLARERTSVRLEQEMIADGLRQAGMVIR